MIKYMMLFLLSLSPLFSNAADIDELKRSGQIEIKNWLSLEGKIAGVNEQIILYIEVATPGWFTGGTQIQPFEVANMIIPFQKLLSTNFTENIRGQTWSRQRWEIRLFPQVSGTYLLPSIGVSVRISTGDGKSTSGVLYTSPLEMTAALPSGELDPTSNWFSASSVSVEQSWELSHQPLEAGDSITRIVKVTASDTLSILMGNLISSKNQSQYHRYPASPILQDRQNRGDYTAERTDKVTYLLQTGGKVSFPAYTFQWWDKTKSRVETVTIEGQQFEVKHTILSLVKQYKIPVVIVLCIILTAALLIVSGRHYYRTRPLPDGLQFFRLVKQKQWPQARTLLYRKLRLNHHGLILSQYSNNPHWQEESSAIQGEGIEKAKLTRAWRAIRKKRTTSTLFKKALPELEKWK